MAYEKNICGECAHFSDTGICRIPMVKNSYRSFFTAACVWFETRKKNTEMKTNYLTAKKEAKPEKKAEAQPEGPKACAECGRILPLEKFHKNRWGYTKICKECHAKKAAAGVKKTLAAKGPGSGPSAGQAGTKQESINEKPAVVVHRLHQHYSPEVVADALRDATDQQLVDELSGRGWRGSVVKEVSMDII